MTTSCARALLEHLGFSVDDIPTSNKKEADFLATRDGVKILIEEKTKGDDPAYLEAREKLLREGDIHLTTLPFTRNETLSGIVHKASRQLRSTATHQEHAFRFVWFTATGVEAEGDYEQFISTLYGRTNILEMNATSYKRCYYFRNADFYFRRAEVDGAVVAHSNGTDIAYMLCLNSLSPRYETLRQSSVLQPFGTGLEDPVALEGMGTAFILDCDLDRKIEAPLLTYLQSKYKTGPLMKIDLGYTKASVLVPKEPT